MQQFCKGLGEEMAGGYGVLLSKVSYLLGATGALRLPRVRQKN